MKPSNKTLCIKGDGRNEEHNERHDNGISEEDTIRGLSNMVAYGSSFPNVMLDELEELIHMVFEG